MIGVKWPWRWLEDRG